MSAKTIIDQMVDRFVGWKLPKEFNPDYFISFDRDKAFTHPYSGPTSTNLLSADQARAMFEHCIGHSLTETEAELKALKALVTRVHAAKGRHHTQLAMCDLFDAVGLKNERPVAPVKDRADEAERKYSDVFSDGGMDPRDRLAPAAAQFDGALDPLYSEAVALCLAHNKGSISLVQRHLRIGYNRAACMLIAMHAAGVVAPLPYGGYAIVPQVDRKKPDDSEGGSHD